MWDWAHFKAEGWLSHFRRSAKFSGLLFLGGAAMIVHMLVPFWQQPRWLSALGIAEALQAGMESRKE
jgi:hypothetical protein